MMLSRTGFAPLNRSLGLVSRRTFQSSAKRCLTIPFLPVLPQKPGGVVGTPNDPYVPPPVSKMEGPIHWWIEKTFAVATLPLAATALIAGPLSTTYDSVFSVALLGYCYMEFHSCITDYIPKRVYGKFHNYALYLLGGGSLISLLGIYKLESEGEGITGLIHSLWTGKTTSKEVTESSK
ncbi:similar to Saccharomyces cerevisiae YDR178W SDH4 Membrane anchor subunit of succinate dehydrogenase [Maudiozyma barnettii]|uniref:Succinate dehydrogenase [ubiquinone] cytochrome b small subunit n=1 Tax=Maudiozyma barnettii TaxID=61262 RepID=A0A8H2VE70_9SACH|nr:succinate dehydrogenase membrane anchor subunit SDH4 [Kazachstania barnettii]CAB4253940.1 similar to Saccharomyces cerevisiae YDR178W SDH4 Membrane anchor subunit of succinate dehydrogenase [Kazachstania barnettii]CAD1781690.1 similar to Saccharomyces cerevisiae YDR178W SDH4 Membrane anchor subunit of succinate dehydrogenase [Kazachstania barnettii]